tara:strand:- start:421 stop:1323 length:903 start_codon:yes stop_codon:yes gene_type:complete
MSLHHNHSPNSLNKAFGIAITLNMGFVLLEFFFGLSVNSLALIADAGHNLSDVAGLVVAWAGLAVSRLQGDDQHTYGWRRGSIMASFVNAAILLAAMALLAWHALERLQSPASISGVTVMVVAGIGIIINSFTALLFMSASKTDLNVRGAFLHMAADALVSAGVVVAGALYLWKGWAWIDPVVSLGIAVIVVLGTWPLMRQSVHLLFDGVPEQIDVVEVRQQLLRLPGVKAIHDLHVWAVSTSDNALTVHLVADPASNQDQLRQAASRLLLEQFGIEHTTIQIDSIDAVSHCINHQSPCN